MRLIGAITLTTLILAVGAMPVMAGGSRSVRFEFSDQYVVEHACGVVESTAVDGKGTAYFDASGTWLRDIVNLSYRGVFTGPGGSLTATARQVVEFTPDHVTARGQGTFIHGGHIGVLVYDVGRLVFDPSDGSTYFVTPKAIAFDDPGAFETVDQALCDLLG